MIISTTELRYSPCSLNIAYFYFRLITSRILIQFAMINVISFFLPAVLLGNDLLASASSCLATPITTTGVKPGSFCDAEVTLRSDGAEPGILIIDHGVNVGGFPSFDVLSLSGNTSILEVTYSETRALLDKYMVCL